MDLDQIETFLAVASCGGFHRAAEMLHVSQPAVSARIRLLEESLKTRLFARSRSNFSLSPAGKAFRPHAEQLLRAVAAARQAVHALQTEVSGVLAIAAGLSISTYLLPAILKKYQITHPKSMVSVRSGNSMQVLRMVLDGEVAIGLARSLHHPGVETTSLRDDPLVLVGHPSHPATRRKRVNLREVESWPLIFYDRGSSDWTLTNGLFRRAGLLPNVVLELETIEACKRMILRKLGLGFLPQLAITQELQSGKLRAIQIADAEPLHRSLDVIRSLHRPLGHDAQDFLTLLRTATKTSARRTTERLT